MTDTGHSFVPGSHCENELLSLVIAPRTAEQSTQPNSTTLRIPEASKQDDLILTLVRLDAVMMPMCLK